MPTKPYQTYIVAWIKDTLQNLADTGFYLYSYEIDHQIKQDEIAKAECLGVGEPKQLTDGTKVVGVQYMGRIVSRGWIAAKIPPGSSNVEILKIESDDKIDDPTKSKLKQAIRNQLINFHSDAKERWGDEWKFGFFQIEYPNPVTSKVFHTQKMNHEMYWDFDSSGKSTPKNKIKSRYYRFTSSAVFDLETWRLLKGGEEIVFNSYDGELKSKLLYVLAKAEWSVVEKEELWKALDLKWSNDAKNKKLRSLIDILTEYDFGKNLGLDLDTIEKTMLVCPPRRGYRFIGQFTDNP